MRTFIKITSIALVYMLISACSNQADITAGAPPLPSMSAEEYRIGVGDVLTVNVWRNEELSLPISVRPDGKISLPLIGDVLAGGSTADELAADISQKLVAYIRNPQVTIIVNTTESSDFNRRIRVTGAIENPLSIPHRDGMTVLDVILEAGGTTDFAKENAARLYRKDGEEVKAYAVKLGDILNKGRLTTNYQLAPGDVITVPERGF